MKIGIITFVNEDNYGAVLQAYAMQTFLNKNNIDSEFVNINLSEMNKDESCFLKKIIRKMAFFRKKCSFKKFRKRLNIAKENKYDNYESIIIGSDQVWNPLLTGNKLQPIFFADSYDGNIVAYACSCGNSQVLTPHLTELSNYLKNIKHISVRENSLAVYLKEKLGIEAVRVLDPVFLIQSNHWNDILDLGEKSINRPYIFVYLLEDSSVITEAIDEMSEKYNIGVVSLRNSKHYKKEIRRYPGADPEQFLRLLSNAEMVVTNSFHAVAFSYIFNKKAAIFPHSKFNERIDNILKLLGLDGSVYYTENKRLLDFSSDIIDKNAVERERDVSVEFIEKALNNHII